MTSSGERPRLGLVLLGHVALDLVEEEPGRPQPAADELGVAGHVDAARASASGCSRRAAPRRSRRRTCRRARRRGGCACRDLSRRSRTGRGRRPTRIGVPQYSTTGPVTGSATDPTGGTVRHVMIEGPGRVVVAEAPEPGLPGPDGAVVSVDATAICGSDMHFYDGDIDLGMAIPVGHEFLGTVLEVGTDGARGSGPGDRVLTASVAGCGRCDGCATGDPVALRRGPQGLRLGDASRRPGHGGGGAGGRLPAPGHPRGDGRRGGPPADRQPVDRLGRRPAGRVRARGHRRGARARCGRAVRGAFGPGAGGRPGAGRRPGGRPAGTRPRSRAPSRSEGPTVEAVLEATGGRGADAVIDAVAHDATLDDALACVRAGGTVSVIGVHDLAPYPLPALMTLFRSVTLRMTTAPVHRTWAELVPLVPARAAAHRRDLHPRVRPGRRRGRLRRGGRAQCRLHQGAAAALTAVRCRSSSPVSGTRSAGHPAHRARRPPGRKLDRSAPVLERCGTGTELGEDHVVGLGHRVLATDDFDDQRGHRRPTRGRTGDGRPAPARWRRAVRGGRRRASTSRRRRTGPRSRGGSGPPGFVAHMRRNTTLIRRG